jgi:glycerol-3-phosphate acyltransferase PlsY
MALYLSLLKGVNFRDKGSGNLGASNATILMGWKAGILVGIHDIGKAFLAVFLANILLPNVRYIGAVAGVAAVIGHIFPFYLKFKGGKGFASFLGMTLALNWKFALIVLALVLLATLITDYIVSGTFTAIAVVPTYIGISDKSLIVAAIILIATAVILFKHFENIKRLCNGTEIGLRSTIKGKNRVK